MKSLFKKKTKITKDKSFIRKMKHRISKMINSKEIAREVNDDWDCPRCGHDVWIAGDALPNYCWSCGQKLK